ncbi:MAG: pyridoxal phosphate-dependent aminotransferase [Filifactoraceae bacterium]
MKFSNRITSMQSSPIRRLVPYAQAAKAKGKKVYHLNIGQPDVKTPEIFFNTIRNFNEDVLAYALSQGIPELIDAMIKYYAQYDMHFDEQQILIMNGGSEALMFAIMAICDPGDEILAPEPFYTNYNGFASAVNVSVKPITTYAEKGFHLPSKEDIVSRITEKTRGILLSNPGNPTGCVYTSEEIQMVADVAKEHDLYIIADEVYREFVYDGLEYTSFGNISEVEDRVIIIDSISKRFSACGARIGSLACKNKDLMAQIMKLCQGRLCVPTIEQFGAAELYKLPMKYMMETANEYKSRRDVVFSALQKMDGILCEEPKGALYVVIKMPVDDAEKFIIWMLNEFDVDGETVMLAPAEGFYATPGMGVNEARIAYVLNSKELEKAMYILDKALKAYPGRTI